jgi:small subunit ribosomal protein S21
VDKPVPLGYTPSLCGPEGNLRARDPISSSPVRGCPIRRPREASEEGRVIVQIFVRDNNVDQALKALKKKMQREGTFREMKRHVHYEKPSEKRARQEAEAVRRARKLARKRAQREGLLPAPKPKPPRTAGAAR